jgi:type VI secretion system protein ImpA
MATPPILAIEEFLAPIAGNSPSGRSLAYEPEYDAIREARRAEDATNQGDWKREVKAADWDAVVAIGTACLREKTKDLQIAAWLTEALARLHGFAGLRDGLTLMAGIQARFWDSYYPPIDDGDLESRYGPFLFLNDTRILPYLIRIVPLTQGLGEQRYSFEDYTSSRETDNLVKKTPDKAKTILADGRIAGKTFDDQVAQTPRRFYETLVGDLKGAIEAFTAFDRDTDERFGKAAPSLLNVSKALDECMRLLEPILAVKREQEPDPEPEPELVATGSSEAPAVGGDGNGVAAAAPRVDAAGRSPAAGDFGRVLIDFRSLAQNLAEAGAKLEENRKKYAELQAELKKLDAEYEEISRKIGRDGESHDLLRRFIELQRRG